MTRPLGYSAVSGSGGSGGAVSSVAGKTGAVTLVAADVSGVPVSLTTQSKTASFTAAPGIAYMVDTTGGTVTATLPAASTAGQQVVLKLNAGTSPVTVIPSGTDTIGAAATTASITLAAEAWLLTSSGAGQWNLTAGNKSLTSLDARYPQIGNNLSDLASPATARTNLGVPSTARAIATTAPLAGGGDLTADRTLTVAAATTGSTGVVQLAGDLAGTATAPTVPGKVPIYSTQSKTTSFTAAVGVLSLVDTTGGAVTATLPAASTAGQQLAIKLNVGTTAVTVNAGGTDTIGVSATTAQITLTGEVWEFTSSGSGQWNLVAGNKSLASLDGRYPQRSNNLSDLGSASTARTNLGLGGAATLAVGTTTGTVAAGDDSRIVGAAQLSGATFTGEVVATDLKVTGTTGAPNVGRFVGVTTTGAPTSGTYAVGDYCLSQNGQLYACTIAGTPGTWVTPADARSLLTTGDETFSRDILANTAATMVSQQLRLVYFTARKTETSTQGRVITGNTAAGATPTLCRFGVYSIASNGDGTLVGSCVNDTALFASTFTIYTRSWSSSFTKTAGQRYAFGILVVSAAAMPTFSGASTANSAELLQAPILCAGLAAQTDLPSTFTAGSVAATNSRPYGVVLP